MSTDLVETTATGSNKRKAAERGISGAAMKRHRSTSGDDNDQQTLQLMRNNENDSEQQQARTRKNGKTARNKQNVAFVLKPNNRAIDDPRVAKQRTGPRDSKSAAAAAVVGGDDETASSVCEESTAQDARFKTKNRASKKTSTVAKSRRSSMKSSASVQRSKADMRDIQLSAPPSLKKEVEVLAKSMGVCQLVDAGKPDAKKLSSPTPSPKHDWIHVDCCNDEIFNYCQLLETRNAISSDFLHQSFSEITSYTRSILVDWMIQVQEHLSLHTEVLHLSVAMVDIYLSRESVSHERVQLLGIACLFIAAKYEQRIILSVDELIYLTDNSYQNADLLSMEVTVLKALRFDLSIATPLTFIGWHLKTVGDKVDTRMAVVEMMAYYLLDLSIVESSFSSVCSSLKCAAAVCLSCHLVGMTTVAESLSLGQEMLKRTDDVSSVDLSTCMRRLTRTLLRTTIADRDPMIQGAFNKYSQEKYLRVSLTPGLDDLLIDALAALIHGRILASN